MKNFIDKKINEIKAEPIIYIIKAVSVILAIIPLFYVFNAAIFTRGRPDQYVPAGILLLIGALVTLASALLPDSKWVRLVEVAGTILVGCGFVLFAIGSILSVIDVMYKIVMWGDPSQYPAILAFGIMAFVSFGCGLFINWFKK